MFNTALTYGYIAKILHWLIGFSILLMIAAGYAMKEIVAIDLKPTFYMVHKSSGVILLILILFRLFWRLINTTPNLPGDMSSFLKAIARLNFFLMYLLMLSVPISGMMMTLFSGYSINIFNLYTIESFLIDKEIAMVAKSMHNLLPYILLSLIGLHFCGMLYHQLIRKDKLLQRLL